ncbi:MAG: hypothetical protein AAGA42_16240 [Actinomycetota bacterium]
MTTPTIDRPTHHTIRFGRSEHPAAGQWKVHRSSTIRIMTGRDWRSALIERGTIHVGTGPSRRSLELFVRSAESPGDLTASAVASIPRQDGFARWRAHGAVGLDTEQERLIDITVDFHGVYRRGTDCWAWITAHGGTSSSNRRRQRTIELELIAHPHQLTRRPLHIAATR